MFIVRSWMSALWTWMSAPLDECTVDMVLDVLPRHLIPKRRESRLKH